jgi:ribosomal protein S17E
MKQPHQIAKEIIEKYKADLIGNDYETPKKYLQDLITVAITEERVRAGKLREALKFYASKTTEILLGNPNVGDRAKEALAEYERGE